MTPPPSPTGSPSWLMFGMELYSPSSSPTKRSSIYSGEPLEKIPEEVTGEHFSDGNDSPLRSISPSDSGTRLKNKQTPKLEEAAKKTNPSPSALRKGRHSNPTRDSVETLSSSPSKSVHFPETDSMASTSRSSPTQKKKAESDQGSSEGTPPAKRKGSDPEDRGMLTVERRPKSVLDLFHIPRSEHAKPEEPPYINLKLTVVETPKTEKPISLVNPFRILTLLTKGGAGDQKANFCYKKIIVENEENRCVIRTDEKLIDDNYPLEKLSKRGKLFTSLHRSLSNGFPIDCDECDPSTQRISLHVRANHDVGQHHCRLRFRTADYKKNSPRERTNQELLNLLLQKFYELGYVENVPDQAMIDSQVKLLYATTTSYCKGTVNLKPSYHYKFLAAYIPAYLLLAEMVPQSLRGAKTALEYAFPILFPNVKFIQELKDKTIQDGEPRSYFETRLIESKKTSKNHVRIKILGLNEAEVTHQHCYQIFANVISRFDYYSNKPEEPKAERYITIDTPIPVGEIKIAYVLTPSTDKGHSAKCSTPRLSIEVRPSKIKLYDEDSLEDHVKKNKKIVKLLQSERNELKTSFQSELKPKKYELPDHSVLHCEEIK